jgi:hypothetical protein
MRSFRHRYRNFYTTESANATVVSTVSRVRYRAYSELR